MSRDSVASAYITVGRLDRLARDSPAPAAAPDEPPARAAPLAATAGAGARSPQRKLAFLAQLRLTHVPPRYKEGELLDAPR